MAEHSASIVRPTQRLQCAQLSEYSAPKPAWCVTGLAMTTDTVQVVVKCKMKLCMAWSSFCCTLGMGRSSKGLTKLLQAIQRNKLDVSNICCALDVQCCTTSRESYAIDEPFAQRLLGCKKRQCMSAHSRATAWYRSLTLVLLALVSTSCIDPLAQNCKQK